MTRPPGSYAFGVSLLLSTACASAELDRVAFDQVDTVASPAASGSGEPNLATLPNGRVLLSWLEPIGDTAHALRFATFDGSGWSAANTIAQGSDFFVNWADFPSVIALSDDHLAAHWLQRNGTSKYAYEVRIAQSLDGGTTWSAPVVPHRDGTATEHGFVSLFPFRDSLGAIWLDGRNFAGAEKGGSPNMMLVMTSVSPGGTAAPERVLDEKVCDCCQTSLALASGGPVVVYRDRLDGEIRDIGVIRWSDSGWTRGTLVHRDNWKIDACPVNGPAIAADGRRVVVAWFTSAGDTSRVYLAQSGDGGATFGPPIRIDDGNPVGRVDVLLDRDGTAVVSWMEFTSGQQAAVRARRVAASGEPGTSLTIAQSSGARASGFPRMASAGDAVIFAWTEPGNPARVRVARASVKRPS